MSYNPQTTTVRVTLGALQGALLYALYQSAQRNGWPYAQPIVFAPLLMWGIFIPLLAICGWGRMSQSGWMRWLLIASLVVGALGTYDLWTQNPSVNRWGQAGSPHDPTVEAWLCVAAGLFMAQALVLSSAQDGRWLASYPTYFDQAWKLLIQHLFSALFVGALWLILWLGSALFQLIGLGFLERLLRESWFAIPVTTFATAWALHLTDAKPEIVRGIRGLLLVLLSWILPVITLLAAGFLVSLPFTGLTLLWGTRHATQVLLSTAAALVILINTAFQHGERTDDIPRLIRVSTRVGCLLLLPLAGLAGQAISLRVGQYGWSPDRIVATACLTVATCYALGYAWAARPSREAWLAPIARVNVVVTWVILAVLIALCSPLADPSRLSVDSQMARLRDGRTPADQFDYMFLRFKSGRWGDEALHALAASRITVPQAQATASLAQAALARQRGGYNEHNPSLPLTAAEIRQNLRVVWPRGARLPDGFYDQVGQHQDTSDRDWRIPTCLTRHARSCEAVVLTLTEGAPAQVLILEDSPRPLATLLEQDARHHWQVLDTLPDWLVTCAAMRQRWRDGQFSYVEPRYRDMVVDGRRISIAGASREAPPASACK